MTFVQQVNISSNKVVIETDIALIYWEDQESGIICGQTKPNKEITIERLKKDFEVYKNKFQHPNKKLLFDLSDLIGVRKEVRDFFSGPDGIYNYFDAIAVFTRSKYSIAGIVANVALKVYVLRKPTKLFYDRKRAIDWLKSIN